MITVTESAERASTNAQYQRLDEFHILVQELSGYLDTAQTLAFSEICDPNAVIQRMKEYRSNRLEWAKYAHEDEGQCFTRNMVERGLGKSNIVCWHVGPKRSRSDHHVVAHFGLDSRKGEPGTRSCWFTLRDESPPRVTERDTV